MKLLLTGIFCFIFTFAKAQTEADFEDYASKVYGYVTATDTTAIIDFIWEEHYLELIDQQSWKGKKKSLEKHNYSRNYSKYFEDFTDSRYNLRKEYSTAVKEGAEVSFLSYYAEPHPSLKGVWVVNTLFLFKHEGLKNRVRISSQATVIDSLIIAVSPLKEHF